MFELQKRDPREGAQPVCVSSRPQWKTSMLSAATITVFLRQNLRCVSSEGPASSAEKNSSTIPCLQRLQVVRAYRFNKARSLRPRVVVVFENILLSCSMTRFEDGSHHQLHLDHFCLRVQIVFRSEYKTARFGNSVLSFFIHLSSKREFFTYFRPLLAFPINVFWRFIFI